MSDRNFFAELKGRDFYDVAGAYALVSAEYFGTETFSMCMRRGFLFFALSACFALTQIKAGDWSEHLTLHDDTQSPDGSYGIVVSTSENEQTDYFADLKTHRLLGKIEGFDYVEGQFHGGLSTVWTPDSTLCVATQRSRFTFEVAAVLEPKRGTFTHADIGARIHKSIDAAIVKESRGTEKFGNISPRFWINGDRTIGVYATGSTITKGPVEGVKDYYAVFTGVFDSRSKKWLSGAARSVSADEAEMLNRASSGDTYDELIVSPDPFEGLDATAEEPQMSDGKNVFRSEESKFTYLDGQLNDVYKAVRLLLPPAEFSKVKHEQIAWVKNRDALPSVAEKSRLTAERSEALRHLVWSDDQQ